ncbi:ribosomal protein L29 [Encephalitozoon hellem]|uniref:Ribosomal protein L29 n=1 Tax=Encephalitozoon hellem TaxID=27973 RepID=A0A9Q9CCZ1_ENCHE|nr:60S ribosomal protein L35 [Encephalitozoon hellem ATCC 50504]XP_003888083.1 60S ribosomal protein L35 [Encephalitozoon hellem ATCC 50504]XP_003888451.1 60S ribosomal protein [Encephalitozoon hellem ATCC 50504]KAG5859271.1 ribosomal protein L29 [Encephalitozoon hellem]AFM98702.1 60S ribosomal protein L35 [Encephalitozoon hellem ATCC 50504]AFM99102.1 60S ribosomal protein L35 [Encephalitozoon hellem ATCC 50504]AFM99470.1 60S ribosomal protein [Encephalitozoon hellem ATCC 50504]UTX43654.1 ri|eukprot:XP_003887683.1 60S ribosomal protein L35 [Encephalitozoon hellem ATCC 50504]
MKIEASDLRQLDVEQLEEKANEVKAELARLRQKKNSGDVGKDDIRTARKNLARILTVRREKILQEVVEKYRGTPVHKLPKVLRPKLNRAKRQALTKDQLKRKTGRQRARESKFPKVIFAYNE